MQIGDPEYLIQELNSFREACGSKENPINKLDKMFNGLFLVAAHTRVNKITDAMWDATCVEWSRRRALMAMYSE